MKTLLSAAALLIAFLFTHSAIATTRMNMEEPAEGGIYTGVSNVRGWAVSEDGITNIELYIDGVKISDIPWGGVRSDVGRAFPTISDAAQSGFSMAFNYANLDVGPHVMRVVAVDSKGSRKEIVRNFNSIRFDSSFITSAIDFNDIVLDKNSAAIKVGQLKIDDIFYDLELGWRKAEQGFAIQKIAFTPLKLLNFATFDTNFGTFVVELDPGNAPVTVANFKDYASSGFYDDTLIHRIESNVLIQGGGADLDGIFKANNAPIINEAGNGLKNLRGTIAMARQATPHSARSQFFINIIDLPHLDHVDNTEAGFGYAVFGKVVSGMEVVDKIGRNPGAEVIVNKVILAPRL